MEVAGLVVGGVALGSLFNTCVDDFNYIRIGLNVGRDLNNCLLQIAVLERRFTRWGDIVRIDEPQRPVAASAIPTEKDQKLLKQLLISIHGTFQTARESSEKLVSKKTNALIDTFDVNDVLAMPDNGQYGSTATKKCLSIFKDRNRQTRRDVGVVHSVQWALYKRQDFEALITSLTGNINDLELLFPSVQKELSQTYKADIEAFHPNVLEVLRQTAKSIDASLEALATQRLQSTAKINTFDRARAKNGDVFGDNHTGERKAVRDQAKSHKVEVNARDDSRVHNGDTYGSDVANAFWN